MSLQVWLPLTKDLRNQGLDNVTITNNGATFDSAGKLGGCYSFNNSAIGIGATNITLGNTFSIACWIKVNSYNSDWANAFKIYKDGYDYIGLCMNQTSASTKQLGFHIYKNNGSNARTGVYDAYYMPLTIGTWYHLCFVVTPSEVKTYQNGINIRTGSITTTFPSVSNYNLSLGKSSLFSSLDCSMNDFRLYDHALSQMEVKELSKGLVLHYPLNRQGWGQENLLPISGSTIINSTQSFEFQGWVQNFYTKTWMNEHLTPGKQYTLSYTVTCLSIPDSNYTFKENRISPILVHQGNGWSQITTTSDGIKDTNMSVGQSRDYKCTFVFAVASESYEYYGLCGYTALYRDASNNAQYARFRINNLKLEEGSIVTPWCPNSSDTLATTMGLNSTTEYDCSGFCNNGTRTGTFTWTSDTPKYSVSTYFDGNSYILTDSGSFAWFDFNQCTIAAWFNPTLKPSGYSGSIGIAHNQGASYKYFAISNYGGVFVANSINGSSYINTSSNYTLPLNEWHHCVATLDGTTVKVYVDGELKNTSTISWGNSGIATDTRVNIGTDLPGTDEMYTGYYSDARIYATALTAAQIKELYNTSMSIDNKGNIYTRELVEI